MNSNNGHSLSFPSILTLIFIVLKLTDVISWSWFWVLSPSIFTVILMLILMVVTAVITKWQP